MRSECAAGGFVLCVCVCWYCVVVSGGNLMLSECAAFGFVACVCVCVAILWLLVEGIKCGVSVLHVALWSLFVCVCLCEYVCVCV